MIWECPRPLYAPQRAMGTTFSDFPILTLTAPTVPVQWWSGRAVGRGPEHHNDDCCDHSHVQAAQWAPIGHCHNSSWPWSTLWAHETIVLGSPSLNEHPFNNVAAHHRPAFVAALLNEYYTSVDGLELYPTQLDAPLSEYAIRIALRVDLGLRFDGQTLRHSTFCPGEVEGAHPQAFTHASRRGEPFTTGRK